MSNDLYFYDIEFKNYLSDYTAKSESNIGFGVWLIPKYNLSKPKKKLLQSLIAFAAVCTQVAYKFWEMSLWINVYIFEKKIYFTK